MNGTSLFMVAVLVIVGYVLGRMWTWPAQAVGLP